ncbi:MAG: YfbM family protein [Planctomycetes bacterium]|nr:YfbM family protein [Planctomycetota bacterium]
MGCLGVHFAITEDQANALICAPHDEALMALIEEIEKFAFAQPDSALWLAETDRAWDAIHRTLTNGELTWVCGEEPLKWVILGAGPLYGSDDYIVCLLNPQKVEAVADALAKLDEASFRKRYKQQEFPRYQSEKGEEDLDYTWHWFKNLPPFFANATKAGRHVVFTAPQ